MVRTKVSEVPTYEDAASYVNAVKEALHGDPAKFKDFLNLLDDHLARRVDEVSFFARAEQIFEDHQNLLHGASVLLPDQATIFRLISSKAEQPTELPDHIERKDKVAENLLKMIKKRFQKIDTHVPKFYVKIMEDFKEGKKLKSEVKEEVVDLLYYHEDLIDEFLRLLQ